WQVCRGPRTWSNWVPKLQRHLVAGTVTTRRQHALRHRALLIMIPQHSSNSCHVHERSLTPPRSDERRRPETSRAEGDREAKRRGRPRRGRRREAPRGGPRWRQAREGETYTRV